VFKQKVPITAALFISFLLFSSIAQAQLKDSLKTGFLPDAAEQYWPSNSGNPSLHVGGSFREVYELFDNYLWGIGPQDNNGYFLHRAIAYANFRYNEHVRLFVEFQSSLISGRNGGARPVQDLDKLAVDQIFGEYSIRSKGNTLYNFRFGKQALNYGVGSLLDIRETNVRRTFFGGKFIAEHKETKINLFAMELITGTPGVFDDQINRMQKIAGMWATQLFPKALFNRVDAYYLYTHRDLVTYPQGIGTESRHTLGTAVNFTKGRLVAYTEADLQLGRFITHSIFAWKVTQTFTYRLDDVYLKPALSVQSAISSGSHNLQDSNLNTFNPIYPKAIYYGYIDNVGSANIFLIHSKIDIEPVRKLKITSGLSAFWRQSTVDGLYGGSGAYLLPSVNNHRYVGTMMDLVALYTYNDHFSVRGVVTYYKRGAFLREDPTTPHDIRYLGISSTVRL
jgi:hypothetical protein